MKLMMMTKLGSRPTHSLMRRSRSNLFWLTALHWLLLFSNIIIIVIIIMIARVGMDGGWKWIWPRPEAGAVCTVPFESKEWKFRAVSLSIHHHLILVWSDHDAPPPSLLLLFSTCWDGGCDGSDVGSLRPRSRTSVSQAVAGESWFDLKESLSLLNLVTHIQTLDSLISRTPRLGHAAPHYHHDHSLPQHRHREWCSSCTLYTFHFSSSLSSSWLTTDSLTHSLPGLPCRIVLILFLSSSNLLDTTWFPLWLWLPLSHEDQGEKITSQPGDARHRLTIIWIRVKWINSYTRSALLYELQIIPLDTNLSDLSLSIPIRSLCSSSCPFLICPNRLLWSPFALFLSRTQRSEWNCSNPFPSLLFSSPSFNTFNLSSSLSARFLSSSLSHWTRYEEDRLESPPLMFRRLPFLSLLYERVGSWCKTSTL